MDLPNNVLLKSNISLMDLPDNVLENIFKYLEIKQQLQLASMNEHFETIIQNVWLYSDQKGFLEIDSHSGCEELSRILRKTHQYIGKIQIRKYNMEQWEIVKQYMYPKAKELSIHSENSFEKKKKYNNLILDVCDLFPNLKSLRLSGGICFCSRDINHLIKLKSLEDLVIWGGFTFNCFQKLFEELKLKSLDVSGIKGPFQWTSNKAFENFCALERFKTADNWNMLQPHILRFSNLKKIWVKVGGYEPSENIELKAVFRDIVEHKRHNITKICLGTHWSLAYLLRHDFLNLKRLEILYQNMNEFTDVFKCVPNLREILFLRCYNMQEEHVKQILKSSQIEFIYVRMCTCEFKTLSIDVNDIVKGRTKPLSFRFWGRPYVKCDFKGESSLFKIMKYRYIYHYFDHYCVEFQ